MIDIARSNGYAIQTVYTHAVQRYVDTGPLLEMGRRVFEMQEAMALDMKQLLESHMKIRKDVEELRAEIERRDPLDDGR